MSEKGREGWTICERCNKSTTGHKIVGLEARCATGAVMRVNEFEVADVRMATGMGLTPKQRDILTKRRNEERELSRGKR